MTELLLAKLALLAWTRLTVGNPWGLGITINHSLNDYIVFAYKKPYVTDSLHMAFLFSSNNTLIMLIQTNHIVRKGR